MERQSCIVINVPEDLPGEFFSSLSLSPILLSYHLSFHLPLTSSLLSPLSSPLSPLPAGAPNEDRVFNVSFAPEMKDIYGQCTEETFTFTINPKPFKCGIRSFFEGQNFLTLSPMSLRYGGLSISLSLSLSLVRAHFLSLSHARLIGSFLSPSLPSSHPDGPDYLSFPIRSFGYSSLRVCLFKMDVMKDLEGYLSQYTIATKPILKRRGKKEVRRTLADDFQEMPPDRDASNPMGCGEKVRRSIDILNYLSFCNSRCEGV